MAQGKIKIHSENILPIIKKWLYSEKDIFVRELVANGCDAIVKLRKLIEGQPQPEWRLDITLDKKKRTLIFSDNGIGMTAEEVEKYIAQIAFSGAEEFLKKYQTNKEEDQIIGHFGLGFYSAYMVAESVRIETLSYLKGASAVSWICDGASTYTLETGTRKERGTDVILTLSHGEEEYLEETRLRQILSHYCCFLPYPIYFNGSCINEHPPLWIKPATECSDKDYKQFYKLLFPKEEEPLFWIHLNVDYPFSLKGILYFPKLTREGDLKKESIKLFCNRVFVSDTCRDLLPDFLTVLRGAIDSPDIPLNVSRSYLQTDKTVRQVGAHISKKIADSLVQLFRTQRDQFITYWEEIELIIKFGALQDESFYKRIQEILVYKNSLNEWTTIEAYQARHPNQPLYYTSEEGAFLNLYRAKDIEVLFIRPTMIDQALMQMVEKQKEVHFKRIDGCLDPKLLDPAKENTLLDAEGRTEAAKLASFFKTKLAVDQLQVEAKSLASESLPAFLMLQEEQRRLRDSLLMHDREMGKQAFHLIRPTLVINTNSKLIHAIHAVGESDPELASQLAHEVYDLARLSQKEMEPEALADFVARSTSLLEALTVKRAP